MAIVVVNCFHWIGFHLTDKLLQAGYKVDGIDQLSTYKKEHLSMFLGRNSSFSLKEINFSHQYETCIIIKSFAHIDHIQADRVIHIGHNEDTMLPRENKVMINIPILFGEWMPMSNYGIYNQNAFLPFDDLRISSEAIYIKDFARALLQWLQASYLLNSFHVKSSRDRSHVDDTNIIYLRDKKTISQNIDDVIKHYKRFKAFY